MRSAEITPELSRHQLLFENLFGIDLRALALMRILLGTILLSDLACRLPDLAAFYADGGALPFAALEKTYAHVDWYSWRWSLHLLFGSALYQGALFALAAVAAAMLLVGYHARIATIVSWALFVSLCNRAPMVINAGDTLLKLLLFWGMFLPLASVWSIDRRRRSESPPPSVVDARRYLSFATAAILLQVCLMYWFTAAYKISAGWMEGDALRQTFEWGFYNRPTALLLVRYPTVLSWLTWGTLWLELIGPILVFCPWKTHTLRGAVIIAFLLLHAGIEATLHIGLFSFVCMIAWTLFLPSAFFDCRIVRHLTGSPARPPDDSSPDDRSERSPGRSPWPKPLRWAVQVVCLVLLLFVVGFNTLGLYARAKIIEKIPPRLRAVAEVTTLRQKWSMFAKMGTRSGWFTAKCRLADDRVVDLLNDGEPYRPKRPDLPGATFKNHRWRKLFTNFSMDHFKRFQRPVADSLGKEWNRTHPGPEQIVVLELIYHSERAGPLRVAGEFHETNLVRIEYGTVEQLIDWDLPF